MGSSVPVGRPANNRLQRTALRAAAEPERCDQCRDLYHLRADVDRRLDGCINHEHPATAANGCAAAGPVPLIEPSQTEGWSRRDVAAPRPCSGSTERRQKSI
jgi:hypothetical protein